MFRDRFWLSLALTIPIVFYSPMIQEWFGYTAPGFPGSEWVAPVLGTVIFIYGGIALPARRGPGGAGPAAGDDAADRHGDNGRLSGFVGDHFRLVRSRLLVGAGRPDHDHAPRPLDGDESDRSGTWRPRCLAELLPDEAERIIDGEPETVSIASLAIGDLVLVRPGARVPADGVITTGDAEMDESMVTGESKPVPKGIGDNVVAGTVATDSAIRVEVTAVGEDTALAGIQRLVAEAQQSRSRAQVLADRAAALLFYVAVGAAAITAIVWWALGQPEDAVTRTVSVLVIACPHALGLAIPLVISISTGLAARNGILVKDRLALERMRTVDVVLFDKTGTLTRGSHVVVDVAAIDGDTEKVLALAAAVEADSEHPLARAIVAAAARGPVTAATGFRSMSGRGVEATVDGASVAVGGPALLRERGHELSPELRRRSPGGRRGGLRCSTSSAKTR